MGENQNTYRYVALIVAAGRGHRAGGGTPKQYRPLGATSVLSRTLNAFLSHPAIAHTLCVIHPDDQALYGAASPSHERLLPPTNGGDSRAESVLSGLRALKSVSPTHVLIHDGARPFISDAVLNNVLSGLKDHEAVVAAIPCVDAMRAVTEAGIFSAEISRENVMRMQTPQAFKYETILSALEAAEHARSISALADDASAVTATGIEIHAVPGDPRNIKLTTEEDFEMAETMLAVAPNIRVGQGFDVHAFGEGDHVTLCGVKVPHSHGLKGHSDADVGLHTLTDALYGAIASGDIGRHFPPSEPKWKGVDSALFLEHAMQLVRRQGYEVANMDITLICEEPKIGPHSEQMRHRVAQICKVDVSSVSVKATTTERLGFCGREEGIAAQASVCLVGASI